MLHWRSIISLIIIFPLCVIAADELSREKKEQLAKLKQSIAVLDERLKEQHQEKAQLQVTLQEAQATERALRQVLQQTKQEMARTQRKHDKLSTEIALTQKSIASQENVLLDEMRLMYRMGPVEQLKMWLNQADPATAYRMQRYFTYLYRARDAHMQTMRTEIAKLDMQTQQLVVENKQLDALRSHQEQESLLLQKNQTQQQQVLVALEADISHDTQARDALLADQKALEQLLTQLAAAPLAPATVMPHAPATQISTALPFAKQKKQLNWPLAGTMLYRFGQPRAGGINWQGIFIQAPAEKPVTAVYTGRVIYADTLRGFGLLLIIDHGDNYMSLYGNNRALYKKVGDAVTIGEQIATAGSGGEHLPYSGLYFEVRKAGEPQDPQQWLRLI